MAHIGVRISKQDKEKLDEIAKETDTTISEITRSLLDKFFKEKEVIKIVLAVCQDSAIYVTRLNPVNISTIVRFIV